MTPPNNELYRADLAQVHVEGYSFHWERAAPTLLGWLREMKLSSDALVVDLGCGGGQWLARLDREGYRTCGVDLSPAMLRLAEANAPRAQLLCGSFDEIALPRCDAITCLGEPLNYLNSGPRTKRTIKRVYSALKPGGLFVFDARVPPERPQPTIDSVRSGDDWFCYARIEEDPERLVRYITTFRRKSEGNYRREKEIHRLKLFSKAHLLDWLAAAGFRVRARRGYGGYLLGKRQVAFVCRKLS